MINTLLKQDLQSSIDRILKAEQYLFFNVEELICGHLNNIKGKFPSLHHVSFEFSNDYSEEYDTYIGPYLSNSRINLDVVELENPAHYTASTENKDFYIHSHSFPTIQALVFENYNGNYRLLNEDLKTALTELLGILNTPVFAKACSTYYEYDNCQLIYNFDTKTVNCNSY